MQILVGVKDLECKDGVAAADLLARGATESQESWDARRVAEAMPLGWTVSRSVIVPLGAVRPGGGTVSRTCVVVQRIFPALYRDRMSDGRYLRHTPRAKAVADRLSEGGMQQVPDSNLQTNMDGRMGQRHAELFFSRWLRAESGEQEVLG